MRIDPWALAARCDRMMHEGTNPDRKIVAEWLRDFWLAVGNDQAMHPNESSLIAFKSAYDDIVAGNGFLH